MDNIVDGATEDQINAIAHNTPVEGVGVSASQISPTTNDPSPDAGSLAGQIAVLSAKVETLEAGISFLVDHLNSFFSQNYRLMGYEIEKAS